MLAGNGGVGPDGSRTALARHGVSANFRREEMHAQDVDLGPARRRRLKVLTAHLGTVPRTDAGIAAESVSPSLHDFWVVGYHVVAIFAVAAHEGRGGGAGGRSVAGAVTLIQLLQSPVDVLRVLIANSLSSLLLGVERRRFLRELSHPRVNEDVIDGDSGGWVGIQHLADQIFCSCIKRKKEQNHTSVPVNGTSLY